MRSCCNPGNLTINSFPQNIKNMQSWHDYWILFAWKFNNKNELKFIETGMALFHHLLLTLNNFNSNSCTCSLVELICVVLKARYCKQISVPFLFLGHTIAKVDWKRLMLQPSFKQTQNFVFVTTVTKHHTTPLQSLQQSSSSSVRTPIISQQPHQDKAQMLDFTEF